MLFRDRGSTTNYEYHMEAKPQLNYKHLQPADI